MLLPQQDVLGYQLPMGAQQVSGEAANERAGPQRFADSFRGGGESQPQLPNDMSEHETDLFRDQPNGKPLS